MSFTPAKIITSSQQGPHKNLTPVVSKHLLHAYRKPIAAHNQAMFTQAYAYWQAQGQPKVILDSACGTGESSRYFAQYYPEYLVIGIDQSIKRLAHQANQQLPDNCLLLRCECTDFWRLAETAQWQFNKHTLLYPNPWPKPQHLQRRWHGSPAFSSLLAISQHLELRTNWHTYADEFYRALLVAQEINQHTKPIRNHVLKNTFKPPKTYQPEHAITAFERKYQLSGHTLWQFVSN